MTMHFKGEGITADVPRAYCEPVRDLVAEISLDGSVEEQFEYDEVMQFDGGLVSLVMELDPKIVNMLIGGLIAAGGIVGNEVVKDVYSCVKKALIKLCEVDHKDVNKGIKSQGVLLLLKSPGKSDTETLPDGTVETTLRQHRGEFTFDFRIRNADYHEAEERKESGQEPLPFDLEQLLKDFLPIEKVASRIVHQIRKAEPNADIALRCNFGPANEEPKWIVHVEYPEEMMPCLIDVKRDGTIDVNSGGRNSVAFRLAKEAIQESESKGS